MIDYTKFRQSLERLQEQNKNYLTPNPALLELDREGIAESVIQRFETCYDCLWKVLKRYLIEELGIADPPNSLKPILRSAFENNLLEAPLSQWLKYANVRINTSHDYNGEKSKNYLELVPDFIDDAIRLYQTITGTTWRQ